MFCASPLWLIAQALADEIVSAAAIAAGSTARRHAGCMQECITRLLSM
jgi:hypothetical protein